MAPPPDDHDCAWKDHAKALEERLSQLEAQLGSLQHRVYGRKSERMPRIADQLRAEAPTSAPAKRKQRASNREEIPTREFVHPVPPEQRCCAKCGRTDLRPVGKGRVTSVLEYVPAKLERHVHVQETLACPCGETIITAPVPAKLTERGSYGPGLVAHLVTAKCADSIPLHRLAKAFSRQGVALARSTLVDLFHRAADDLAPLSARLLSTIASASVVQADETPMKIQAPAKCRTGYLWTFLAGEDEPLIGYRFSPSRSGRTPTEVLGGSTGALVVDAYTGYNPVTTPEGRERVGCWAHVRRKFFEASAQAPEAKQILELILALYRVEAETKARGIVRTREHRALRQERSVPILAEILAWLQREQPLHPPKSLLGAAIRYALAQWVALNRFADNELLPLDNNRSERALRVAALGRKNFLFVGHEKAGENLAGLYSLVATCEANGVNPQAYLADVLLRVHTHPNSDIDALLPHRWARTSAVDTS